MDRMVVRRWVPESDCVQFQVLMLLALGESLKPSSRHFLHLSDDLTTVGVSQCVERLK